MAINAQLAVGDQQTKGKTSSLLERGENLRERAYPQRMNDFPDDEHEEQENTLERGLLDDKDELFRGDGAQETRISTRVMNLANTIVGAGMMALPKVIQQLGIVTGVLSLVLVLLCAIKTLNYMLKESDRVRSTDFTVVVRERLGSKMAFALDFTIIINNVGLLIIYLRIISDVLIGNSEYQGIIPEFLPSSDILTKPEFTVGLLTLLILFPLCSLEKMDSLSAASTSGLSLAIFFGVITVILSIIEISKNGLQGGFDKSLQMRKNERESSQRVFVCLCLGRKKS
jgi:hypothetical protein